MSTLLIGVGLYVVWTVIGIVFFLHIMGQKFRKTRWYDWPLLLPVMPIAFIIGLWSKE